MHWRDIGEFNPAEYGTDALLLKMKGCNGYEDIVYGWYDPEASAAYPWRFIDDHGFEEDAPDKINVNGAPPIGSITKFVTFGQIPK